ncbi:MAG: UvrD-helicase domain-containing protein [Phycisphaeraceae bacterium]
MKHVEACEARLRSAIARVDRGAPRETWVGGLGDLQISQLAVGICEDLSDLIATGHVSYKPEWLNNPDLPKKLLQFVEVIFENYHKAITNADQSSERGSARWAREVKKQTATLQSNIQRVRQTHLHRLQKAKKRIAEKLPGYIKDKTTVERADRDEAEQFLKERVKDLQVAKNKMQEVLRDARYAYKLALKSDYLAVRDGDYALQDDSEELDVLHGIRKIFVWGWCKRTLDIDLDDEQVTAVGSTTDHYLVTARAGSGKTRTVVARAAFLVRHCRVPASQILILAFNRKAAAEVHGRLKSYDIDCQHVMTFHALAYAVVRPKQELIYDEPSEDAISKSAVTQRVVNDYLSRPDIADRIQSVMLRHFTCDWDEIANGGLALSRDEGLMLRRSLEREALDGTRVKSFGEKVIANYLFEHGIRYGYERNHWWGERNYRPDFSLPDHNIVIEYFGMAGDPDYNEVIYAKREYWKQKKEWTLLEYGLHNLRNNGEAGLQDALKKDLSGLGVPIRRLTDEEIWRQVQERCISRFAKILTSLIGRARKALMSPDELNRQIQEHVSIDKTEEDVLSILSEVYKGCLDRMHAEGLEDFDGLMQRASDVIAAGHTTFERKSGAGDLAMMRFIMVDEYQDFSPLFDRLLDAVLSRTRVDAKAFGVGDDWQAINAFAGSDLRYLYEFTDNYTPSSRLGIATNYRSAITVVELGNKIMTGRGVPARARRGASRGVVQQVDLASFRPDTAEFYAWGGDPLTPAIRRLIRVPIQKGQSVAILARQRYLPYPVATPSAGSYPKEDLERLNCLLKHGLTHPECEQIHVGTVHQYKGREADLVIVVDAVERRYPKLHPDWVFGRVFGDDLTKLIDEERRLFYVGCSRAAQQLILITEGHRMSPFLDGIKDKVSPLDVGALQRFCPGDGDWILQLGNAQGYGAKPTLERAETLRESNYLYRGGNWPHWAIRIPKKYSLDYIVQNIDKRPWFDGPDGLALHVCRSDGGVAAKGLVVGGEVRWESITRE